MSDKELRQRQRGDERLMLTCLAVERLCAEHVPAAVRLEAEIGPATMQRLVVPLARRLTAQEYSDRSLLRAAWYDADLELDGDVCVSSPQSHVRGYRTG